MSDDLQILFRLNLREYMVKQGRQWTWLAAQLGISTSYLNNMLTGDKPVRPDLPQRVADVFHMPPNFLFAPIDDAA